MGRRTLRPVVEAVCRTLEERIHLPELVRRVAEAAGVEERPGTSATVRETLARLPFMVRAGTATYAPARVVLAGKAFRLTPPPAGWCGSLPRWRLEPFASALEHPPLVGEDGRPLTDGFGEGDAAGFEQELDAEVRRAAGETVEFVLGHEVMYRAAGQRGLDSLLDWIIRQLGEERSSLARHLAAAMAPYRLPEGTDDRADLIVRYDPDAHVLRVVPERPSERDQERIRREDRRFCDFVAARVREGSGLSLRDMVLQAYAQLPGFGDYPGSPPEVALERDGRLRLVGERGAARSDCTVVKANDVAFLRELERRRALLEPVPRAVLNQRKGELRRALQGRIRQHLEALARDHQQAVAQLGLRGRPAEIKPDGRTLVSARQAAGEDGRPRGDGGLATSNEALLARWEAHLTSVGLSEGVRRRKLQHLSTLAEYLASGHDHAESDLAGATGPHLMSFFFWMCPRRYPSSPSDAETFTLDVRDFYRWLEQEGLIPDARFAELPYRLRRHVAERIRLYTALDPDDPGWEQLYEMLFLSGTV